MYTMKIKMAGEEMNLTLSRHARTRINQRSDCDDPDDILMRVSLLLERDDIADYLMNEVRIGDVAVILDEDNGCSYSLGIHAECVDITTVFYSRGTNRQRIAQNNPCIIFKNAEVIAASLFCDIRTRMCLT